MNDDNPFAAPTTDGNFATNGAWTNAEIVEVAKRQKQILWMILLSIVAIFIPFATIVTGIIQVFFIYKLAIAVRSKAAWVYIVLAFIPLVGLLALLSINGKATKILQSNGLKVGLMGARSADVKRLQAGNEASDGAFGADGA
ncbi:MAG: hypothetical protein ACRDD1_06840 [Planctomycetia bacterium]